MKNQIVICACLIASGSVLRADTPVLYDRAAALADARAREAAWNQKHDARNEALGEVPPKDRPSVVADEDDVVDLHGLDSWRTARWIKAWASYALSEGRNVVRDETGMWFPSARPGSHAAWMHEYNAAPAAAQEAVRNVSRALTQYRTARTVGFTGEIKDFVEPTFMSNATELWALSNHAFDVLMHLSGAGFTHRDKTVTYYDDVDPEAWPAQLLQTVQYRQWNNMSQAQKHYIGALVSALESLSKRIVGRDVRPACFVSKPSF